MLHGLNPLTIDRESPARSAYTGPGGKATLSGVALLVWGLGYQLGISWVMLSGVVLFSHASLDRIVGYGLKYGDDFKHTHLQEIPDRATN